MFKEFEKEIEKYSVEEIKQILLTQSDLYDEKELKLLKEKVGLNPNEIKNINPNNPLMNKIYVELLEIKLNQIKNQQQFNYIKSINTKLTFFVVLTIISIATSIILALK